MKIILLLICTAVNLSAQGYVIFNNRTLTDESTGTFYNAQVSLPDGSLVEGSQFTAGLFLAQANNLTLVASTPFRDSPAGGYFVPVLVEVPGVPEGSAATFVARVWETSAGSFDAAVTQGRYYGQFNTSSGSAFIEIAALQPKNPPGSVLIPDMSGIQPLILVPEPQTLALMAFAASFVFIKRFPQRRFRGGPAQSQSSQ